MHTHPRYSALYVGVGKREPQDVSHLTRAQR